MPLPIIEPITEATLAEFVQFLHTNMKQNHSVQQWQDGFRVNWPGERPNYGFMLRDNNQIVGGIGAYYVDRIIKGQLEKFCNITSWCVLKAYRSQSMRLAMAVIQQPGYHFTDFSPTKVVSASLHFLKFRPLDERQAVLLNLPINFSSTFTSLDQTADIEQELQGEALQIYQDHANFSWLRHIIIGKPGAWCYIIYKRKIFKKFPAAIVLYLSDSELFENYRQFFCTYLFLRGFLTTHVECRFLKKLPLLSKVRSGFNAKLYLSKTLIDEDIDYLYSETMALDL